MDADAKADSIESLLPDNSILKPELHHVDTIASIAGSTTNEKPLGFLDLSPEVRNMVYQYSCIYETCSLRGRGVAWASTFADLRQPPITRVNKKIRSETLPIFYVNHEFVIQLRMRPWDWRPMLSRHRVHQDPFDLVRKSLNAFTPDPNNNVQASSLRFLSKLTLDVKIESSRQPRLEGMGFVMSSRELVCHDNLEQLVKTAGLDWNKCGHVRWAYVAALDSCPLVRDAHDLLNVSGSRCDQFDQAASELAALMCRIAKLCPQLARNVSAFVGLDKDLDGDLLDDLFNDLFGDLLDDLLDERFQHERWDEE